MHTQGHTHNNIVTTTFWLPSLKLLKVPKITMVNGMGKGGLEHRLAKENRFGVKIQDDFKARVLKLFPLKTGFCFYWSRMRWVDISSAPIGRKWKQTGLPSLVGVCVLVCVRIRLLKQTGLCVWWIWSLIRPACLGDTGRENAGISKEI